MNNAALSQAVQKAAKPKFRGHTVLKSKVAMHFPANLVREYIRVTNSYMTLLNKTLAKHLPVIRRAVDAEREGMRTDDDNSVLSIISLEFVKIQEEFEKEVATFGLERKLNSIANLTSRLSVQEWKRVVQNTLGINILEDYYMGEFYRETFKDNYKLFFAHLPLLSANLCDIISV